MLSEKKIESLTSITPGSIKLSKGNGGERERGGKWREARIQGKREGGSEKENESPEESKKQGDFHPIVT